MENIGDPDLFFGSGGSPMVVLKIEGRDLDENNSSKKKERPMKNKG